MLQQVSIMLNYAHGALVEISSFSAHIATLSFEGPPCTLRMVHVLVRNKHIAVAAVDYFISPVAV